MNFTDFELRYYVSSLYPSSNSGKWQNVSKIVKLKASAKIPLVANASIHPINHPSSY
jgi:hypothetical protein